MQSTSEIVHDLQANWPIYAAMPVMAAVIGWFTKLVAIKMMFRPHVRRGIGPLGWQGIIPRRAPQMVDVLCETLTGRLISAEEIIDRIDGDELARRIERPLRKAVATVAPQIVEEYQPAVWNLLPRAGRDAIVQRAQELAPDLIPAFVEALRDNIDEVFDLRAMVTEQFLSDPDILESMFLDVGRREFTFIRRSGLGFGFCIGLVQVVCWALFHEPLLMPVFGLFTGWFTDWAALRLIFTPREPTKYLGVITWQGLFLKHRIPVSEEYGVLIASRVLTAENLVTAVMTGPRSDRVAGLLAPIIEEHVRSQLLDLDRHLDRHARRALRSLDLPGGAVLDGLGETVGSVVGGLTGAVGAPLRAAGSAGLAVAQAGPISEAAAAELVERLPGVLAPAYDYLDEALEIRTTMATKMVAMTPAEFEGVLRPAFQQDERTLIMVGAILGFLVGEGQVLLLEHLAH
ncbi:DUF445 family protein [Nocardioides albidus]|uniref:DUF445 family protein n=1 Tax=Nocardioides albidus TaxID=1517589 RepID=A0A5C4VS44_9ACTN|nr:DUF445 family protein [Nocardioides albidus]TNM38581.1 DUF445 family protein [Nocardioides albidus]